MKPITTVAIGFDGSPESRVALLWAASLCVSLDASLKVVHAVGLLEEAHLAALPEISEVEIHALASEAGLRSDRFQWCLLDGSPADVLLRVAADSRDVDLLVVGRRGAGHQSGMVLGSTSLEVVERAIVPVVVIPHGD